MTALDETGLTQETLFIFTQTTVQGEIVVDDAHTGMMWQHTTVMDQTWQQALAYCESLSYAGHDDWRLPNMNSMASLVNFARARPASDFPDMVILEEAWTSTPDASDRHQAWTVPFLSGQLSPARKSKARDNHVRCVR